MRPHAACSRRAIDADRLVSRPLLRSARRRESCATGTRRSDRSTMLIRCWARPLLRLARLEHQIVPKEPIPHRVAATVSTGEPDQRGTRRQPAGMPSRARRRRRPAAAGGASASAASSCRSPTRRGARCAAADPRASGRFAPRSWPSRARAQPKAAGRSRCPVGMGSSIASVTIVSTSVTSLPRWFGRGTPVGAASAEVVHLVVHTPLLRAVRDAEPGAAACRVLDHVEVNLAVGDAATLGDLPEAGEHRARDHQVRHEELRTLGRLLRSISSIGAAVPAGTLAAGSVVVLGGHHLHSGADVVRHLQGAKSRSDET